jgi:hypothetical protein
VFCSHPTVSWSCQRLMPALKNPTTKYFNSITTCSLNQTSTAGVDCGTKPGGPSMAQLFKKLAILSALAWVFSPSSVYADQFLSAAVDQAQTTPIANAPATNPNAAPNAAESRAVRLSVVCSVSNATGSPCVRSDASTGRTSVRQDCFTGHWAGHC